MHASGQPQFSLALSDQGLRCRLFAFALHQLAARRLNPALRLLHLRFGLPMLGIKDFGIHQRYDLPGCD